MSTLTQFVGGGGGGVKGVQRGVVIAVKAIGGSATNVTISAVNLAKSFVVISFAAFPDTPINFNARLTTTTNLSIRRATDGAGATAVENSTICWEVIEYE